MSWIYVIVLCYIAAGISYFFTGSRIYLIDKKSKMRRTFFITALMLGALAISYGLMTVVAYQEAARVFWSVGFIMTCMFLPFWISFLFQVASIKTTASKVSVLLLFLGGAVVAASGVLSDGVTFVRTDIGFNFTYSMFPFVALPVYVSICAVFMMLLILKW